MSDLGEVVILDADSNTVETPFDDLESLPTDVVRKIISKYVIISKCQIVQALSCVDREEYKLKLLNYNIYV